MAHGLWQFFHLLFAIGWVGSLVVAEWNGRAVRATSDWTQRAALFQIIHMSARVAGAGSLLLAGLLGFGSAATAGIHLRDSWLWAAALVWVLALFAMFLLNVPYSARLAAIARLAASSRIQGRHCHHLILMLRQQCSRHTCLRLQPPQMNLVMALVMVVQPKKQKPHRRQNMKMTL